MTPLRQDTFDSFLERNKTAAAHFRDEFSTRHGRSVRIAGPGSRHVVPLHATRAGFSVDGEQAMVQTFGDFGDSYSVWEKKTNQWTRVAAVTNQNWGLWDVVL
jgi:hypothetical protein